MITVPETWNEADLARARAAFPSAHLAIAETAAATSGRSSRPCVGRGRLGYSVFCKLHSKRSPHRAKGDHWRAELVDGLLGGEAAPWPCAPLLRIRNWVCWPRPARACGSAIPT
jgi:lipopolysaccharide biosynthesis protein